MRDSAAHLLGTILSNGYRNSWMGDISRIILLMVFLLNRGEFRAAGATKNKRVEFLSVSMEK